jgi:alginate O-acetyltransferase complex protein AlgI
VNRHAFQLSRISFLFLPLVLLGHGLAPRPIKNGLLLLASLFFYAWGETIYVFIMLGSIGANYALGLCVGTAQGKVRRLWLGLAVVVNLGLLGGFKYANFLAGTLNEALLVPLGFAELHFDSVHLPIGISFFTFQALSYIFDVYRGNAVPQRRIDRVALYIAMFPQLIAGPIVRYLDIADQLIRRKVSRDAFAEGVTRFVIGLGKKLLIANTLAVPADRVFSLDPGGIPAPLAWWGISCYAFQIYFDFSGYSDMAIGLGKMFGFRFPENFNYPYIATSMTDFWRRWHISLSTWFRDYVYIPLGGNRRGGVRTGLNLVIVFFLCGLWHGANWAFVVWGLWHGIFLVVERPFRRGNASAPDWGVRSLLRAVSALCYIWGVVLLSWVVFRSDTLAGAMAYTGSLAGLAPVDDPPDVSLFVTHEQLLVFLIAAAGCTPVAARFRAFANTRPAAARVAGAVCRIMALAVIFTLCSMKLAAGTYNPFIYFRF